ncbi:phosphotransferase [Cellulomonas sp. DKR-3]|uniref:Phosphotransferase n=1 Tax=Cellulomonas fulva TaxID=2835530 RepID=A0ABS5U145_9CELL|nr:phosphotransferase [Cellulomonas fulva]MBT0995134.1 phosphotransferase [Cellulomonas fulva]
MKAPSVTMLWESVDAHEALLERFGFADATAAAHHLTVVIADHWDLRVTCERVVLSDQNLLAWVHAGPRSFVVKACAAEALFARLAGIAEVVALIGGRGLPVAAPVPALDGTHRVVVAGPVPLSVFVMPLNAGAPLDPLDHAALRATGAALARMHRALAEVDPELPGPVPHALLGAAGPRPVSAPPEDAPARARAPRAAARLDSLLGGLANLGDTTTLVHGDVRGANVLIADGGAAVLLDHDSMGLGHRVLDLARGAATIATQFRSWDPPPPGAHLHVLDGYRDVAALSSLEEQWLHAALLAESLRQIPAGDDPAGWAVAVERDL